ncbi:MAG: SMC-Scp complex subunit ScpB [Terracidiphilus sp.]|jgi:segregation and condensation protein B
MSLKAKLEAVIYAAEEPVTLAQLAVLFAADVLEWKAEQEAASAEQAAQAELAAQPVNEHFAYLEMEPIPAISIPPELASALADQTAQPESSPEPDAEAAAETSPANDPDALPDTEGEAAPEEDQPAQAGDAAELEARRQARQRDREARAVIRQLLDELIASYASDSRGVEIREIAGGYRMATKPECHDAVRLFVKSLKPALRLSLPALETLAVIAYKQPVTAPEVNEIRGVDSSGVFGSLLARKLISTAGRKPVIGRPILYKTTREFLLRFGLKDVAELPSMEEFEKLATIELDEPEPAVDEDSEQRLNRALGPEFDEAASEALESEIESPESTETAETAVSNEPTTPAEAAPAAPPATEQEETENSPHDEAEIRS